MNVAIMGCGLIGRKRALALNDQDVLVACCDSNEIVLKKFSSEFSCTAYADHKKLLAESNCDSVIVSVVNKYAKEIITDALIAGKHVLAEKPLGRNFDDSREILNNQTSKPNLVLKTGFNHRFHPAIWKAKQLTNDGIIGKIFNIRATYGHGGRPGMEKEWRASNDLCGGGELLDQGVHIIDLIRWFGGEVKEVYGKVETKFWEIQVEDNAFAILKTAENVTASFHVSWTNWKNIFSFEIFGTDGYLKIEGLGGSYGVETLEVGKRNVQGGKPDIQTYEFSSEDISWKEEWKEFKNAILEKRDPIGSGIDGLKANKIIYAIYRSDKLSQTVTLN